MTDNSADAVRVLVNQQRVALSETQQADALASRLDRDINNAEKLLASLEGVPLAVRGADQVSPLGFAPPILRPWTELVQEALVLVPEEVSFVDLLAADELATAAERLSGWNREFRDIHRLRGRDYAVAGAAGIMAGLVDVLLVKVPARAGLMGGAPTEGGWLSNAMKDGFSRLLPPDTIRALERSYPVPFDASNNIGLAKAVPGLGPRSHRLQSLGHDPLLGWIFGVWDILTDGFTAIGSDGRWVFQSAGTVGLPDSGVELLVKVINAFCRVGGHMLSDIATSAGLPPPLFGLLQMIQGGNIGGRSVAELSRAMYAAGYDFRHFLAGGVGVALTEAIVRFAWMAGELLDGKSLDDALPIGRKPRLQTSLFLAHSVAAAVNAGKVAITNNPLSVNWAQWLVFFRYLLPQARWCLIGKEAARSQFVSGKIDNDFLDLQSQMAETWRLNFGPEVVAVLS